MRFRFGDGRCILSGLRILDTFNLDERSVGVGVALASLVRQVLALDVDCHLLLAIDRRRRD